MTQQVDVCITADRYLNPLEGGCSRSAGVLLICKMQQGDIILKNRNAHRREEEEFRHYSTTTFQTDESKDPIAAIDRYGEEEELQFMSSLLKSSSEVIKYVSSVLRL